MANLEETGKKMQETGKKMKGLGCLLTILITVPIILTLFLGPIGLVLGGIIFVVGLVGAFKSKKGGN